ncbi:hypothetical protein [Desulfobulbus sp.]|uniref:hypothetical protein n=1 Tax=Desulfobulbus sp. TaxID=895 RepID=UPI00286F8F25|nr:hypothetical protein [Desulfobulbus sp.]
MKLRHILLLSAALTLALSGQAFVATSEATMVYPAAGVPSSTGSEWGPSYTVGTAANNLVQLNASAKLPAVSGSNLFGSFTGTTLSGTTNIQSAIQTLGTAYDGAIGISAGIGITIAESSGTATIGVAPNTYQPLSANLTAAAGISGNSK